MRYGTRTELKRRWTPVGHRPRCRMYIGYDWAYLYAAINPYSGDLFCLLLPYMTKECFAQFLEAFQGHIGQRKTLLILDKATNHQAAEGTDSTITLAHLPTACPELNPAERFFQELRKQLANQVFLDLQQVEEKIIQLLQPYWQNPKALVQLCRYPFMNTS
jgi:transposase